MQHRTTKYVQYLCKNDEIKCSKNCICIWIKYCVWPSEKTRKNVEVKRLFMSQFRLGSSCQNYLYNVVCSVQWQTKLLKHNTHILHTFTCMHLIERFHAEKTFFFFNWCNLNVFFSRFSLEKSEHTVNNHAYYYYIFDTNDRPAITYNTFFFYSS